MSVAITYAVKERMIALSGACFWFWGSFHGFLKDAGVPSEIYLRYPQGPFSKYQAMRNILDDLEKSDRRDIIQALASNYFRLRNAVDRDQLNCGKARDLLKEFRELLGNDPIEIEIARQRSEKAREDYDNSLVAKSERRSAVQSLHQEFLRLAGSQSTTPQQRGFELEQLFFELLRIEEVDCTLPYRTKAGEQIDGHFSYEKFDYLVEAKWISGLTKQPELSIFDGKIRGKAQSTRGLFLAANGFDENAVRKYSGDEPRILLMTGEDLAVILAGGSTFLDVMRLKVDAIVRHGNILARALQTASE